MMSNSFLCSPQASSMLSFRSKHVWLLTKHVANRGCNISETLTCAHHNVCSIAIRCFIRRYHFLLRSIESRNKTIRTQTVLLPKQNIKEANMFLFGRAWLSLRVWNAIVSRYTENFHFESRMGSGPSLTKHLNRWNSTLDSSQAHRKLFDFRIG